MAQPKEHLVIDGQTIDNVPVERVWKLSDDGKREYGLSRGVSYDATGPNFTTRHYSYEELELFNTFTLEHWESPLRHEVMSIKRLKYSDGTIVHRVEFSAVEKIDGFSAITKRVCYDDDGAKQVQNGGYSLVDTHYFGQDSSSLLHEIPTIDQLPDSIDTMATYQAFISQAEKKDFSYPQLILPPIGNSI